MIPNLDLTLLSQVGHVLPRWGLGHPHTCTGTLLDCSGQLELGKTEFPKLPFFSVDILVFTVLRFHSYKNSLVRIDQAPPTFQEPSQPTNFIVIMMTFFFFCKVGGPITTWIWKCRLAEAAGD